MAVQKEGLLALLRELDDQRQITLARARELYGGKMSDATWKRVKKRLAAEGCTLEWIGKKRIFKVADPMWTLERGSQTGTLRDRLTMLRAGAAALGSPYVEKLAPLFEQWDAQLAAATLDTEPAPPLRPQPRADATFFARLATIEAALRDRRMISFAYAKPGGRTQHREIEPYALHEHVGRFYVWGRESVRQAPKFFAIDLMRDVALEDEFDPDPKLDLASSLRHSFGMYVNPRATPIRVVVEIDPARAAYVRARRWPAETMLEEADDGKLRVTFTVTDPFEIVSWVLGFGGAARILEPAGAADYARRAAEHIAELHTWSRRAAKDERMLRFEWPAES